MSLTDLINLIREQDDFSVGVLPHTSIKQWNPSQSSDITKGAEADIIWWGEFSWKCKITNPLKLKQLFCHLLIEKIPEQGIEELFETMKDIYKFYITQKQSNLTPLYQSQHMKAKLGKSVERPEFSINYNE